MDLSEFVLLRFYTIYRRQRLCNIVRINTEIRFLC